MQNGKAQVGVETTSDGGGLLAGMADRRYEQSTRLGVSSYHSRSRDDAPFGCSCQQ